MGFTIKYQGALETVSPEEFGDEAIYEIVEGGVLKVTSPDTDGKISYTPANAWLSLFADKNHPPGVKAQRAGAKGIW
ncbi:hypothetical protein H7J51_05320 [Mycobacterium crocinum]|uniref:Uncharacterized protein n=1 Tax=Mycolicibacterium crocinum TaxID=388459 RepID=A0ABY3TNV7_9MYCO|nr:hypothetical protein [Mycolicibacterium crocinum]MCV7214704.1 hypothetical protein [Mycolicibacterium crocinum]ULN41609.1 hypothetical protein MI149_00120 [Mycolicibacterium crocinum]